jgi:hypothetical protein
MYEGASDSLDLPPVPTTVTGAGMAAARAVAEPTMYMMPGRQGRRQRWVAAWHVYRRCNALVPQPRMPLPGLVWTAMSTSCYQQFRWFGALTCNQAHNSGAQSQVSHHKGQCCQGEGGHCLQGQLLSRDQVPGWVTRHQGKQERGESGR